MPPCPVNTPRRHDHLRRRCQLTASLLVLFSAGVLHGVPGVASRTVDAPGVADSVVSAAPDHLVISEVVTGGASASDEFIELHNPATAALPLAGLELIYASASGATVTRKASWNAGEAVEPGGHLLVANETGSYAAAADTTYAGGLAATGGSVALRAVGADTAIDAVGWGSAASTWLEGSAAPAPAAGHSLERLPGGALGSGQDTDMNANDFVERDVPDPQGTTSGPTPGGTPAPPPTATPIVTAAPITTPSPMATLVPTPTPSATPTPTPMQTPTPAPGAVLSIAAARALPDGVRVSVEGVSLTDGSFNDGGGYLADGSAGIAVLVSGATFPRGALLRVSGELDDRYHQRTIRAAAEDVSIIGSGEEPAAIPLTTGAIGESREGVLVLVAGEIVSARTQLSGGVAFDLDDGSGPARVVILDATGIDTGTMLRGATLRLVGVLGQRDSTGTGTVGYRIQPRDVGDILDLAGPAPSGSPTPAPTPTPGTDVTMTIAQARLASPNARVTIRGVVTLPTSVFDDGTATIQDETGAIVLRLSDRAGDLALDELVLVRGVRSTKSGMETLRVTEPPLRLGVAGQPVPQDVSSGTVGEALEARLVSASGVVTSGPQKTSARNIYFDVDDGSGPLRIFLAPGARISSDGIVRGSGVQVIGVIGQETSGQQPLRGYRVWPRSAADLRILSAPTATGSAGTDGTAAGGTRHPPSAGPTRSPSALPVLPVPGLAASSAPSRPLPSIGTPRPTRRATETEPAPLAPLSMALLAVVLAGGAGVLAAHRPGLAGRLREAMARIASPGGALDADAQAAAQPPTRIDVAAARLVPLRLIDGDVDDGVGSRGDRTAPRSERILPPT